MRDLDCPGHRACKGLQSTAHDFASPQHLLPQVCRGSSGQVESLLSRVRRVAFSDPRKVFLIVGVVGLERDAHVFINPQNGTLNAVNLL